MKKKKQTVGSSCQRKIDLVGFLPCSGDTSYHASSLGMTYLLLGVSGHLHGTAHTALLLVLVRTNIFIVKILTMYSFLGSSFLLSICLGCGDTSVLVGTCMGPTESWPEPLIEHLRKGPSQH